MATIAKLVIQSILDPTGVNRGAKQIVDQIAALDGITKKRRELNLTFPKLKIAEQVQKELAALQRDFDAEIVGGKEGLARKIVKPEEFKKAGIAAAIEFDKGILSMIDNLRAKKQLTPTLHKALVDQLKNAGLAGGASLSKGLRQSVAAHPLLGNLTTTGQRAANTLLNGLNKEYNQRINKLREDFANKVITVQQFRLRGRDAADAFDKGVSAGLEKLRAKKQATGDITEALVSSYKLAGLKAANAFNLSVSKQLGENISSVGRTMTRAVTLPVVAAGAAAIKLGADFELSMNRIQAITQATGADMEKLAAQARKLGAESQFSAKDAAEAQAVLAQQSLNTTEILSIMPTVLNVAAASMISMSDAANLSTKILKGFNIPIENFAGKMDEIVKLSLIARTNIQELTDAFKFAGPAAARLGVSFEEVGAAIGALSARGLPGTLAGTALRGVLNSLIKPSRQATKALKELQIEAFNADGTLRSLTDIVKQFEVAQKRAGNDKQFNKRLNAIFQTRAGTGFATLLQVGSKALEDMKKQLSDAGGTAQRVADTQMKGAIGAFREFISAIQELGLAVVDSGFLKFVTDITRGIANLLLALSKTNPGLLKFVTQFLLFAAVVGPVLLALGKITTQLAIVRAILIALNGAGGFAGLASFLAAGGAVLVGLGLLAAIVAKVAINLANARKELEDFNNVLQDQTQAQLEKTRRELQNSIDFNKALFKTLQAAQKKKADDPFFAGKGLAGPTPAMNAVLDVLEQQKKKLAAIDVQMAKLKATAGSANKTLAETGKTPLDQLKTDIDAIAEALGDLDLDDEIGGKTKSAVESASESIDNLIKLSKLFGSSLREQPALVKALQDAYTLVNNLLLKQKSLLTKESAQLMQMKADLQEVFDSAEFKFAKIPQKELAFQLGLDDPLPLQVVPILGVGISGINIRSELERAVDDFQKVAKRAIGAKLDLDIAVRLGKTADVKKFGRIYEEALTQAAQAENVLKTVIFQSNLSLEKKQELWDELSKTINQYDKKQTSAEKRAQRLDTRLHGIGDAVRGINAVASAMGSIGQRASDALDATADLVDALANFAKSAATGDIFGAISSAIGAIGSLIKLGKSFFGKDPGEAERKKIIADNTAALHDAARALDGFKVSVAKIRDVKPVTDQLINIIRAALVKVGNKTFSNVEFKSVEDLDRQLKAVGSSFEELQAIAKDLGINIFNEKGRLSAAGLDALNKAMDLQIRKLTEFGKSLDDTRERLELRRNVLNLDTSGVGVIEDSLSLLNQFAPGIRQMLGNFDIKTEAGRAQLEKAVQQFFLNLENGLIDKKLFANISIDELTGIIKSLADSFDELRETTDEAVHSISNVPQGYKIERARFQATLTDLQEAASASARLSSKLRAAEPTTPTTTTDLDVLVSKITDAIKGVRTEPGTPVPGAAVPAVQLSDLRTLADEIAKAVQGITITVQPATTGSTTIDTTSFDKLPNRIASAIQDTTLKVESVAAASPSVNVAAPNVNVESTADLQKLADQIANAVKGVELVVDTAAPSFGAITADISSADIDSLAKTITDAVRGITVAVETEATAEISAANMQVFASDVARAIQGLTLVAASTPVEVTPTVVIDQINFQKMADQIAASIKEITLTVTPTPVTVSAPEVTIDSINFEREAQQIAEAISKVTLNVLPVPVTVSAPDVVVDSINFVRLVNQIADAVSKATISVEPVPVTVNSPEVTVDEVNFTRLANQIAEAVGKVTLSVEPVPVTVGAPSVTVDEVNFVRLADQIAEAISRITLNIEPTPVTVGAPTVTVDEVNFVRLAEQIAEAVSNITLSVEPTPVTVSAPTVSVDDVNFGRFAAQIAGAIEQVTLTVTPTPVTVESKPIVTVSEDNFQKLALQVADAVSKVTLTVTTTPVTVNPNITIDTINFERMAREIADAVSKVVLTVEPTPVNVSPNVAVNVDTANFKALADLIIAGMREITFAVAPTPVTVEPVVSVLVDNANFQKLANEIVAGMEGVTLTVEPVPVTVQPNVEVTIDSVNFEKLATQVAAAVQKITLNVQQVPVTVEPTVTVNLDAVNFQRLADQIVAGIQTVTLNVQQVPVTVDPQVNVTVDSINFERLATQVADAVRDVTLTVEPVPVTTNPTVLIESVNFENLAKQIATAVGEVTLTVEPVPVTVTPTVVVDDVNFGTLADRIANAVSGVTLNVEQVPVSVSPVVNVSEVASFQKLADQIAAAMKNVTLTLDPVPVTVEPIINVEDVNVQALIAQVSDSMDRLVTAVQSVSPTVTVGPSVATVDPVDVRSMAAQIAEAIRNVTLTVQSATPTTAGTTSPAAAPAPVSNVVNNTMNFDATIVEATNARSLYRQLRQIAIDEGRAKNGPEGVKAVTEVWP